jgi:hypothetical protein
MAVIILEDVFERIKRLVLSATKGHFPLGGIFRAERNFPLSFL